MGFFSSIASVVAAPVAAVAKAAAAPVTATVSSVQAVAKGDLSGAAKAALGGAVDPAKPLVDYSQEYFINAPKNFGAGVVGGVKGVVKGDWTAAAQSAARAGVSGTNIAVGEGTVARLGDQPIYSPTGYGALAYGDTSSDAYKRALITTAALYAGGVASGGGGFGSAAGSAPSGGTTFADAVGFAEQVPTVVGIGGAAAAALSGEKSQSAAIRAPAGVVAGSTQSVPPALLALGAVVLFLIIKRVK